MFIGFNEIDKEESVNSGYTKVYFKPVQKEGQEKQEILPELFSNEVLALVKTKEPTDYNFVRDKRCEIIVKNILAVLLQHNVKLSEMQYVIGTLSKSLDDTVTSADKKKWNGIDEYNRSLIDIHNFLLT